MINNITDSEMQRVAKGAMQHKETLDYIKRVIHADNPQQQILYDNPIHLTRVGRTLQAFRVRLSSDLKQAIFDAVDPQFTDRIQPNLYTAPLSKLLDNGQKVSVGLVEANQGKQAKITQTDSKAPSKELRKASTAKTATKVTTKKVAHKGRPKKTTK